MNTCSARDDNQSKHAKESTMTSADATSKQLPTDQEIKEGFDLLQLPPRQQPPFVPGNFIRPYERCSLLKPSRITTSANTGD